MTAETSSCIKCGETKPIGEFDWRKGRAKPSKVCVLCKRAYMQAYHQDRVQQGDEWTPKTPFVEGGRRCAACKEVKPLEVFDKDARTGKALSKCTPCRRAYSKEWSAKERKRNPGRARKSALAYYYRNHDASLERSRAYFNLHRRVSEPNRLTCKLCKVEKGVKEFQRQNASGSRYTRICNACFDPRANIRLRKARVKAAPGSFNSYHLRLKEELQGGRCYYCKQPIGPERQIEHKIPISRGGTNWPANIALACPRCNLRKHDKTPQEFRKYLEQQAQ